MTNEVESAASGGHLISRSRLTAFVAEIVILLTSSMNSCSFFNSLKPAKQVCRKCFVFCHLGISYDCSNSSPIFRGAKHKAIRHFFARVCFLDNIFTPQSIIHK